MCVGAAGPEVPHARQRQDSATELLWINPIAIDTDTAEIGSYPVPIVPRLLLRPYECLQVWLVGVYLVLLW